MRGNGAIVAEGPAIKLLAFGSVVADILRTAFPGGPLWHA
jgi:hypothetical protein